MNQQREKQLQRTGYITFLFSGICAIGSGIIVSILQEQYHLAYEETGTLLSVLSIGNMAASFAAGMLSGRIGMRTTVLTMALGYPIGYLIMTLTGNFGLLLAAFALVGIAKGCALNQCSVLSGNGSGDKTKRMNLMHSCYALGALTCPFFLSAALKTSFFLPICFQALAGLAMWLIFLAARLPGRNPGPAAAEKKTDFSFLKTGSFWLITGILFCQNAAETSVVGWLVTYFKDSGILSGTVSTYTVTVLWGATLIARLLIAFVFPIRQSFRWLAVMGAGCTILYGGLMSAKTPLPAILLLFLFAFSMAGVNPTTVAAVGKNLNSECLGIMLPLGGIGAILMPWIIGIAAEQFGLAAGMTCNLIPCAGILILSLICLKLRPTDSANA